MTDAEQRKAAKEFAAYWEGKGYEKGESQKFWLMLLQNIFGITDPDYITFEERVKLDHTSFIDAFIPKTHVMIEQKSREKNLKAAIKQSDGTYLTPFRQAKRYSAELPYSQRPRWIVICNFRTFHIYDMERPGGDPEVIELKDLKKEYYRLSFLADTENEHIQKEVEVSVAAGKIVGLLYDAFLKEYADPESEKTLKSLNVLCVRLVFCLYAEDAGIFGQKNIFYDYLRQFDTRSMRKALIELFKVLDTKPEDRDPYLEKDNSLLAAFPYVNGGLFADEDVEVPPFTDETRNLLLTKASLDFDWSRMSCTIFGSVFESTINPETRRSGGMHYTSIENIHKVIDPLFLDDLNEEFEEIRSDSVIRTRDKKLKKFQEKLASLTFLDPACGSGNFLTETYLSLRRLENKVINLLKGGQMVLGDAVNPIKVSIEQFYGIEINDFAVTVARAALWIAEFQMKKATESLIYADLEFLPLTTSAHIVEGNALKMDWEKVVPKDELDYIMGNPPFVGYVYQTREQKEDLQSISKFISKNSDYVSGWYFKAADMMKNSLIRAAFVSTNSIVQGEQVLAVWKPLFEYYEIHIDFAYRTFRWDSEANLKAHVYCVIIGFSIKENNVLKKLFEGKRYNEVDNINAYLINAPIIFIERRSTPICDVPMIYRGSQPTDDGNLILSEEEKTELLLKEPQTCQLIRPFMTGKDFIQRKSRYCLWMEGVNPALLRKCPSVLKRINQVRTFRLASKKAATRKKAETPMLFDEVRECKSDYVAIPETSSERRRYVPMGFMTPEILCSNAVHIIPDATLYHFGVLTSNVHMAWMRTVCGRLKNDYRYSNTVVYNNFLWPSPSPEQKARIEQTAQAILDARSLYPDSSLADLYDDLTMPPELRKAHLANDLAVMDAYGWKKGDPAYHNEADCVAELMKLYQKAVDEPREPLAQ